MSDLRSEQETANQNVQDAVDAVKAGETAAPEAPSASQEPRKLDRRQFIGFS